MLRSEYSTSHSEVLRCLYLYEESPWMTQTQMQTDRRLKYNKQHCHWWANFLKGWTTLGKVPKQRKYHCPQCSWLFHSWENPMLIKNMQQYYVFKYKIELGSANHNQAFHLHKCLLEHWEAVWDTEQYLIVGMSCAWQDMYPPWTPSTKCQCFPQSGRTSKNTPWISA